MGLTLAAGMTVSSVCPTRAATYVGAGQNTVEQGTVVYFNSSDRQSDASSSDSQINKKLLEAQEKVDSANAAVSSNMNEQYALMQEYLGLKNAKDIVENQGAASKTNTLSDEEFTKLANRLGAKSNPFNDIVSDMKPNTDIIDTVGEVIKAAGKPSDVLKNEDGSDKTAGDFFKDYDVDQAFRELCKRLGVDPDTFLQNSQDEMKAALTAALKERFDEFMKMYRQWKMQIYLAYLQAKDDAYNSLREAAEKEYQATIATNGDLLEVTNESKSWWDEVKDLFFYRQADVVYTCKNCLEWYGWKDGKERTCLCGKKLKSAPREHLYTSEGLSDEEANDQYKKCQYCKKSITANNVESFYYQTQASGNGTGTFALICSDCANYDGVFYYEKNTDTYAAGHGDAFYSIGKISKEELAEYKKIKDPTDPWYVEEKNGTLRFPNQGDGNYVIGTPQQALGNLTPYIQIEIDTSVNPGPNIPDKDTGGDAYSDDDINWLQDYLDNLYDDLARAISNDSMADMLDLLKQYDDTGYLNKVGLDVAGADMEGLQEAFDSAIENMATDIVKYQNEVIEDAKKNNAYDRIKDSKHVNGVKDWDERMNAIFGEWPDNYDMWTDEQKALYAKFMAQYNSGGDALVDEIIDKGILDKDSIQDILDGLEDFKDGYTDITDSVKVNLVVDTTVEDGEDTVYQADTRLASSYQIVVNGTAKAEMPWAGGYAELRCSNIGTYIIRRTCELARTTIYTGKKDVTVKWTATKGGQTVTLYEKTSQFSYCDTYSKNISSGKERMKDIKINVVAGSQTDLTVTSGFTSERVY